MIAKRDFNDLIPEEKEALEKLHRASGVTSTGPCDLARRITGERTLQPSDETSRLYNLLVREGWIVVRHRMGEAVRYGVADDYLELQQV